MSEATLYDQMSAWMTGINGKPLRSNRGLVTLWLKKHGEENVRKCFETAKAKQPQPVEPVSYVGAMLSRGVSASTGLGDDRGQPRDGADTHDYARPHGRPVALSLPPAYRDQNRLYPERDRILAEWEERNADLLAKEDDAVRREMTTIARGVAFIMAQERLLGGTAVQLELSPDDVASARGRVATRARMFGASEKG